MRQLADTGSNGLRLLARALLLGVGPDETARALCGEFGWDATVQTLAELDEPQAGAALRAAVAAREDVPAEPPAPPRRFG